MTSAGSFNESTGVWDIGPLAVSESATLTFNARIVLGNDEDDEGESCEVINTASVSSGLADPDLSNNAASAALKFGDADECEDAEDARTIGYWRNHEVHISRLLERGPIELGDTSVVVAAEAVDVLSKASARDARDALRAQLLATILNLRNNSDPLANGEDIRPAVEEAINFLATHPNPVGRRHPAREMAISLKDRLDAYNNSGER